MARLNDAVNVRKRVLIIAAVFCVSLTSLVAGLVWRQVVVETNVPTANIQGVGTYESQWKALNSTPVQVNDWKNQVVLLNFWGSWCPPCVEEMPMLDQFNASHDEIQIVGIVVDEEEAASSFLTQHEIKFPSLLMDQSIVTEMLQQYGNADLVLPFSAAFDQSGELFFTKTGPFDQQELQDLVE